MNVTDETITDEQIRELHDMAARDRAFALKSDCAFAVFPDARVPHGHEAMYARDKQAARVRCADAWNALMRARGGL